jgi:hypothetical protein
MLGIHLRFNNKQSRDTLLPKTTADLAHKLARRLQCDHRVSYEGIGGREYEDLVDWHSAIDSGRLKS